MENLFYKWLIEAVAGLILIGFGLSVFGQAVIYKSRGEKLSKWFLWGTVALVIVNAGICTFGDAVKTRIRYEDERKSTSRTNFEVKRSLEADLIFQHNFRCRVLSAACLTSYE